MTQDHAVIAIIIGRAGSRGLPGKNMRPVAGRPMVAWTIDAALEARAVTRVVVSTDGDAIAATARARDVEVVRRPAALATDAARVDETVRHAIEAAGDEAPIVVVLYANVPVRPAGLVDRAVSMLETTGADSVQSYTPVGKHHPHWMVRLDDAAHVSPLERTAPHRRQDLPTLYLPDGGVIAVTRESLFAAGADDHPHAFLGRDRRGVVNEPGTVVDVDEPVDLARAEAALGGGAPVREITTC